MAPIVARWLPVEMAACEQVQVAISGAVREWSAQWLSNGRVGLSALTPFRGGSQPNEQEAPWVGFGGAVSCRRLGMAWRLISLALDAELEITRSTAVDRAVLGAFEQKVLEDLARRVEQALSRGDEPMASPADLDRPHGAAGGLTARLGEQGGGDLLELAIPMGMASAVRLARVPTRRLGQDDLVSRVGAIGPTPIILEASLGEAEVLFADLRSLAPGDVVILNRALEDRIELTAPGSDQVVARASLTAIDDRVALSIEA